MVERDFSMSMETMTYAVSDSIFGTVTVSIFLGIEGVKGQR
jgi:hypothetical protein